MSYDFSGLGFGHKTRVVIESGYRYRKKKTYIAALKFASRKDAEKEAII